MSATHDKTELDGQAGTYIVNHELPGGEKGITSETASGDVKYARDGVTVLIPQPSDDPDDPLNWSWAKKHGVMLALGFGCLLSDWGLTYGTTLFQIQAMEWHMTPPAVANSISGGIFMQAPGGLLAVPLCQRYGRLPVLFWSQFLSMVVAFGSAGASSYAGFTACRTLQGFFGAPPQVIGLTIIHDMFFFHERARKVNIWAFSFLIGPYAGPFVSGFLIEKLTWRATMYILGAFYAASTLTIVFLGHETLYDRSGVNKPTTSGLSLRIQNLLGTTGARASGRPSVWTVTKDCCYLFARPYLFLPTAGFVMIITMWTIGIVSTISLFVRPPPYHFSQTAASLLYLAPMIGTVIAELWGHWFNDFLQNRYIRTHNGQFKPEVRLWGVYPAWIMGIAGLVLFGEALQHTLHWVAIAFGWGMNCFSTLGTTAAISAYVLDCFPQHAALASSWINFWRVIGGFSVVYFQVQWVHSNGPAVAFGCQAAIVAAFIVPIILTQLYGARWRVKFPAPKAEN